VEKGSLLHGARRVRCSVRGVEDQLPAPGASRQQEAGFAFVELPASMAAPAAGVALGSPKALGSMVGAADLCFPSHGGIGCTVEVISGKRGSLFVSSAAGHIMAAPRLPAVFFVSTRW